MSYVICNGYYVLNVNGKNYVVDETSGSSFVLQKKCKIRLNGKTFSPRLILHELLSFQICLAFF